MKGSFTFPSTIFTILVILAFLIFGQFPKVIKGAPQNSTSLNSYFEEIQKARSNNEVRKKVVIPSDIKQSKISFTQKALLDPVYVDTLRQNLVKFLKKLENSDLRKGRQDDGDEDGDGEDAAAAMGLGGIAGVLQAEGTVALGVLQALPSVLPQFVSALTQFTGAVDQNLNGTDTPNVPSLLVKHGSQLLEAIQAFQSGRPVPHNHGGPGASAAVAAAAPLQRPQQPPPQPNYGFTPQMYPGEIRQQPAYQPQPSNFDPYPGNPAPYYKNPGISQPIPTEPPRTPDEYQNNVNPPPRPVNHEPYPNPNPGNAPPHYFENPERQPPPQPFTNIEPQNTEDFNRNSQSQSSSMSLQQIYNHMAHNGNSRNQLLKAPPMPFGGNQQQEEEQKPYQPSYQEELESVSAFESGGKVQAPSELYKNGYPPTSGSTYQEEPNWGTPAFSQTPEPLLEHKPSSNSFNSGRENSPLVSPSPSGKRKTNVLISTGNPNFSSNWNIPAGNGNKVSVVVDKPTIAQNPYAQNNLKQFPPTSSLGNPGPTRKPGYWMNKYYPNGVPVATAPLGTTLRPKRRRKSTTTAAPEYYDEDDNNLWKKPKRKKNKLEFDFETE